MESTNAAAREATRKLKMLTSEPDYFPLEVQFERFLDDDYVPKRTYEVDVIEPVAFIHDEDGEIDGNLDIVGLLNDRINRYFDSDTVSDLTNAVGRLQYPERSSTRYFKIRSFDFKKFLIIRGSKVLEMHHYTTTRLAMGGVAAEARLSYISNSYLPRIKDKADENDRSCFIRYRDIPS